MKNNALQIIIIIIAGFTISCGCNVPQVNTNAIKTENNLKRQ